MELKSRLPSTLVNEQQPDEVNTESESDDIKWETEISFEDAYKALEEKLYGFKKVRPVLYLYIVVLQNISTGFMITVTNIETLSDH